jgi:hypothetical protein
MGAPQSRRDGHTRQIELANLEEQERLPVPEDAEDRKVPAWEVRLVKRAIKEGWPITEEQKALVVGKVSSIVANCKTPKHVVAAAKVLVSADVANTNREKSLLANELAIQAAEKGIAPPGSTPNVNVQVNVNNISSALQEPEYLEYLRSKSLETDCNAGAIRT